MVAQLFWNNHLLASPVLPRGGSFVCALFDGICLVSHFFSEALTETSSVHRVGVQTWLRSSHEGNKRWPSRGGLIRLRSFWWNLPRFALLYRDGFYTLGRCTQLFFFYIKCYQIRKNGHLDLAHSEYGSCFCSLYCSTWSNKHWAKYLFELYMTAIRKIFKKV